MSLVTPLRTEVCRDCSWQITSPFFWDGGFKYLCFAIFIWGRFSFWPFFNWGWNYRGSLLDILQRPQGANVVWFLFSNPQQHHSDQNTEFTLGQFVQTTQQIYNPTFVYSVFPSENWWHILLMKKRSYTTQLVWNPVNSGTFKLYQLVMTAGCLSMEKKILLNFNGRPQGNGEFLDVHVL